MWFGLPPDMAARTAGVDGHADNLGTEKKALGFFAGAFRAGRTRFVAHRFPVGVSERRVFDAVGAPILLLSAIVVHARFDRWPCQDTSETRRGGGTGRRTGLKKRPKPWIRASAALLS